MHFLAYVSQNKIDNEIKIAFLRDFNTYRKISSGSFYRFTKQKPARSLHKILIIFERSDRCQETRDPKVSELLFQNKGNAVW